MLYFILITCFILISYWRYWLYSRIAGIPGLCSEMQYCGKASFLCILLCGVLLVLFHRSTVFILFCMFTEHVRFKFHGLVSEVRSAILLHQCWSKLLLRNDAMMIISCVCVFRRKSGWNTSWRSSWEIGSARRRGRWMRFRRWKDGARCSSVLKPGTSSLAPFCLIFTDNSFTVFLFSRLNWLEQKPVGSLGIP